MNRTKRLISLLFVGLASAALFAACGDETSCLEDGDCAVGEICVAEVCEVTCTSTADCAEGEACGGIDGDRTYCIADQSNNTNNNNSNNNTTETNNNTTVEPVPYAAVLIRDITTGEGCNELDPGSDVAAAALQDLEGNTLGFFQALSFELGPEANDFSEVLSILDGTAPDVGLACPEDFNAETVVALGCGGYVVGNFVDSQTTPLYIDSSNQIAVQEYGPGCGTGSAADTLEIVLCTDAQAAYDGDISSCTIVLNSGSGLVIADNIE